MAVKVKMIVSVEAPDRETADALVNKAKTFAENNNAWISVKTEENESY